HLGIHSRRPCHRHRRGIGHRIFRRRLRRYRRIRAASADSGRAADRSDFWHGRGARPHMSGYLQGVVVLLAVNIVFAYGAFLPLAAGQLNLGIAGFGAIGAYASAFLSNVYLLSPSIAILTGGFVAGAIALVVAIPVLRTRGIYLALAT